MNFTRTAVAAVELRREESRGRLEDLIGPAQLGVLLLQRLDFGAFLAADPRPLTGVHLHAAHPLAQRLGASDAQLRRHRRHRRPLRWILGLHLGDHAYCSLPQLPRVIAAMT